MNRLWHCFLCSLNFEGPKGICPQCNLDGSKPEAGGAIAPRAVIHFDPPDPAFPQLEGIRGLRHHACDPTVRVGSKGMRASGEIGSVTCPACKETEVYKRIAGESEVPHAYRVPA